MQCLFLFRDASGWLPTAQELHRCGFVVSHAALPGSDAAPVGAGPALAAEQRAEYGAPQPQPTTEDAVGNGAA